MCGLYFRLRERSSRRNKHTDSPRQPLRAPKTGWDFAAFGILRPTTTQARSLQMCAIFLCSLFFALFSLLFCRYLTLPHANVFYLAGASILLVRCFRCLPLLIAVRTSLKTLESACLPCWRGKCLKWWPKNQSSAHSGISRHPHITCTVHG